MSRGLEIETCGDNALKPLSSCNQIKREPICEYDKILNTLEEITKEQDVKKQSNMINDFVSQRQLQLENNSIAKTISPIGNMINDGYIHPDTLVNFGGATVPLKFDSKAMSDIYRIFLKQLIEIKQQSELSVRQLIPYVIQNTIYDYFKSETPVENHVEARKAYYEELYDKNVEFIPIDELKSKGFPLCTERACIAQNIITFVGIDSLLVCSYLQIGENGKESSHHYNLLKTKNGCFIYDPMNPTANGLGMFRISQEQYEALLKSEPNPKVKINYVEKVKNGDATIDTKKTRIYWGNLMPE